MRTENTVVAISVSSLMDCNTLVLQLSTRSRAGYHLKCQPSFRHHQSSNIGLRSTNSGSCSIVGSGGDGAGSSTGILYCLPQWPHCTFRLVGVLNPLRHCLVVALQLGQVVCNGGLRVLPKV